MGRRKPASGKAKKEQLQDHRAYKATRSSLDVAEILSPSSRASPSAVPAVLATAAPTNSQRHAGQTLEEQRRLEARRAARSALESRFIKLSPAAVEHYKTVLAKKPFDRPITQEKGCLSPSDLGEPVAGSVHSKTLLLCPKRPKWKYYMLKKEVEKNESVMFERWLASTDAALQVSRDEESYKVTGYFERNLDVWRQLWRVSEASEILLILLDVRCPLLHFPPSLQEYVSTLKPHKECIMVLTKVDLVPEGLARAWKEYLEQTFGYRVVMVDSYKEHARGERTQGSRTRYDPGASETVRNDLVDALQSAHSKLCTPHPRMKPENAARWQPRVRTPIDWPALRAQPDPAAAKRARLDARSKAKAGKKEEAEAGVGKAEAKKMRKLQRHEALADSAQTSSRSWAQARLSGVSDTPDKHDGHPTTNAEAEGAEESDADADATGSPDGRSRQKPPYLSIGLIGQPNVGKSSLLNALLGKKVVRASKTPGKTKHLQTIFWTPEVRLVDCPGLVFPSQVGLEKQVLSAVIPIQNVEAVVYELGQRMPLERILALQGQESWSTDDLLSALALDRGFLTAKAARPDVYRAGSVVMRAIQASQIRWGFRPPGQASIPGVRQTGIWVEDDVRLDLHDVIQVPVEAGEEEDLGTDTDDVEGGDEDSEEASSEGEESESSAKDDSDNERTRTTKSAFALLSVEDGEGDAGTESESEEDEEGR